MTRKRHVRKIRKLATQPIDNVASEKLRRRDAQPLRTPALIQAVGNGLDQVVPESHDDQDYGYLRVIANEAQLRIEYHPASDGPNAKTPDDAVTIDLATRSCAVFRLSKPASVLEGRGQL